MIRAIDEIGQTVDYVTADWFALDSMAGEIKIYNSSETVAVVPGHWIVKEMPPAQVDPGVEGSD